jgi:putative endonuclease
VNEGGKIAEQLAATYLQQQGLTLLASNYHCRFGEIDLIMRAGNEIVFVELRLRSNTSFGGAAESITPAKRQKLARTADHYLMQRSPTPCRFDAVLLDTLSLTGLQWIRNAFDGS